MSKNYIKLQNQGNIYQNLMLLNEMNESIGYADENGYFSKRAVAEIAINSAVVTSAGKMGDDIIALVNDTVSDESRNSVLQNAKQRMQILRVLGLVASDYDAEQYAITECLDAKCIQIDRLVAIKQAKIEKLEQYKKSLIYEYVTGKREVM